MDEIDDFLQRLANIIISKNKTIATAESCTGGLIGHMLTNISGSSKYFERGIIAYSNQAKNELLMVSKELLDTFGAVSEPVAKAMAAGIRKNTKVDIGISSTGIAGPTGGTDEKPVGLVYIGISTTRSTQVHRFHFIGNRIENKYQTAKQALHLLYEVLEKKT
jgi:PncC family amidohydrolase